MLDAKTLRDHLGHFVRVSDPPKPPFRAILRSMMNHGQVVWVQPVDKDDLPIGGYPYPIESSRVHLIPKMTYDDKLTRRRRQQDKSEAWGYGWIDRYCPTRIYSCHPGYNSLPEIWRDTRGVGNIAIIEISTERRIWEKRG